MSPSPGPARRRAPGPATQTGVSSIHDVARRAGVSTATVSRALRGLDNVSESTRTRVLSAARDLHYVASPTATSLATGRTGVVGVVAPFVSRWFFATVLGGAESRLRAHGLHVLLFSIGAPGEGRKTLLDMQLLHKRFDALLVIACDLYEAEIALLRRLGIPIVTVGLEVEGWDRVGIDDVAAADTAMTHLLGLGHRRVAFIGGDDAVDVHRATAVHRMRGVRRALHRAGLPTACPELLLGDWTPVGAERAARELLARPDRPSAVLAASDEMAMGVLSAAHRLGLRVPDDVSVMGIDDHELAFTHALTTVAQPVAEQGELAAQLLIQTLVRASGGPGVAGRGRLHLLPTRVVERGSTGPVARAVAG